MRNVTLPGCTKPASRGAPKKGQAVRTAPGAGSEMGQPHIEGGVRPCGALHRPRGISLLGRSQCVGVISLPLPKIFPPLTRHRGSAQSPRGRCASHVRCGLPSISSGALVETRVALPHCPPLNGLAVPYLIPSLWIVSCNGLNPRLPSFTEADGHKQHIYTHHNCIYPVRHSIPPPPPPPPPPVYTALCPKNTRCCCWPPTSLRLLNSRATTALPAWGAGCQCHAHPVPPSPILSHPHPHSPRMRWLPNRTRPHRASRRCHIRRGGGGACRASAGWGLRDLHGPGVFRDWACQTVE